MRRYSVKGPFTIPHDSVGKGRMVATGKVDEFWGKTAGSQSGHGCYLFCMTTGKGIVPWYAGKTSKRDFEGERFTADKLIKYNSVLLKKSKSKPVLFFVRPPTHKGKRNQKQIARLETWLIAQAKAVNPDLLNKQNIPRETWGISGVIRSGPGKPSAAAKALRRALDIASR